MTLSHDLMTAVSRGEIATDKAFAMQREHDANLAAGRYAPALDTLAPYLTDTPPPKMARSTESMWTMEVPRILNIGGDTIRELLAAHEAAVESRADLTPCQKNALRGVVLRAWQASDEYPDEAPLESAVYLDTVPVAVADVPNATPSGAGLR
jgi:hypothetical protein